MPPILLIHLKRFSFRGIFSDRIDTNIHFPLYGLDLQSYLPPDPQKAGSGSTIYDCYAVSQHFGTLSSGHYTALVRALLLRAALTLAGPIARSVERHWRLESPALRRRRRPQGHQVCIHRAPCPRWSRADARTAVLSPPRVLIVHIVTIVTLQSSAQRSGPSPVPRAASSASAIARANF